MTIYRIFKGLSMLLKRKDYHRSSEHGGACAKRKAGEEGVAALKGIVADVGRREADAEQGRSVRAEKQ